jgi:hypothetical protein
MFFYCRKKKFKETVLLRIAFNTQTLLRRYDVVIDLHNILSRFVRKTLMPSSWSEFDRTFQFLPERTRNTINAIGIVKINQPKNLD